MPVSGTADLTGTMSWASVESNLDQWRSFLNGGSVAGDFDDDAMAREAFFRPDIQGFPGQHFQGQSQQLYWLHLRNGNPGLEATATPEMFLIQPKLVSNDNIVRTDVSRRIYLPGTRWVQVFVSLSWVARNLDGTAAYPTGVGGDYGGRFGIYVYDLASSTETVQPESETFAYPTLNNSYVDGGQLEWAGSLGEGKHDIFVGYDLDGANTDFEQLTLRASNMKIQAVWQEQ